jgi:hypothetical protein
MIRRNFKSQKISFFCFASYLFWGMPQSLFAQQPTLHWQNGVLFSLNADGTCDIIGSETGWISTDRSGEEEIVKTRLIPAFFTVEPQDGEPREIVEIRSEIAQSQRMMQLMKQTVRAHEPLNQVSHSGATVLIQAFDFVKKLLDLVPNQVVGLERLIAEFNENKLRLEEQSMDLPHAQRAGFTSRELHKLRNEFSIEVTKLLLPHQIRVLNALSPDSIGIFRLLGATNFGESLGLRKTNQKFLTDRSREIYDRLADEIELARRDAEKILRETLTEEQLKQLHQMFPGIVEKQIKNSSANDLLHVLRPPEGQPPKGALR